MPSSSNNCSVRSREHIGIKTFDIPDKHPVTNKPVPAITVLTDSTSATSLVQKMGLNRRSKHIELKFLWLQDHQKMVSSRSKGFHLWRIQQTSFLKCVCVHLGQTSSFLWASRTSCRRGGQLPSLQQQPHLLFRHQVQEGVFIMYKHKLLHDIYHKKQKKRQTTSLTLKSA